MKRIKIAALIYLVFTFCMLCHASVYGYESTYKDMVFKKVLPTRTMAALTENSFLRAEPNYFSAVEAELKKDAVVEVLQDYSEKWYRIEYGDEDAAGWVPANQLEIHQPPPSEPPEISEEELEAFADIMNFPTNSGYFIWTDIARQKTYVFKKDDGFTLMRTFLCSTGKSSSPTTRGFFIIKGRGKWFYSKRLKSGAMYWLRFNGSYLFHSVAMDKNKNVIDGVLSERRSSGCVRLDVRDAEWLYKNIPDGTGVFIH